MSVAEGASAQWSTRARGKLNNLSLKIKQENQSTTDHAQILDRLGRMPRPDDSPKQETGLFQMTETYQTPIQVLSPLINIKDSKLFAMPKKAAEGNMSQVQLKNLLKMVSSKKIIVSPPQQKSPEPSHPEVSFMSLNIERRRKSPCEQEGLETLRTVMR